MTRRGDKRNPKGVASAGRSDAVSRLFAEHNSTLLGFLRLRVRSDQEAREIAQEAYVRLLQLDEPDTISFLRAYLFRIASNLATDRLRRAAVRQVAHSDPVFEGTLDEIGPDRSLIARQQLALVETALAELPESVRRAFLLHRLEGLTMSKIGGCLGVSERTAYNYIVRAMVHCRERLDGMDEQERRNA